MANFCQQFLKPLGGERKDRDAFLPHTHTFCFSKLFTNLFSQVMNCLGLRKEKNWINLQLYQPIRLGKAFPRFILCTVNIWFGLLLTDRKLKRLIKHLGGFHLQGTVSYLSSCTFSDCRPTCIEVGWVCTRYIIWQKCGKSGLNFQGKTFQEKPAGP